MDTTNSIKKLSKFLSKNLKDKNVKQSEILELLAQFNGFKDWNSFSGKENKNLYDPNNKEWTRVRFVHLNDNGGYCFSYNSKNKILYVVTLFPSHAVTTNYFNISKKSLKNLYFHLKKPLVDENENPIYYPGDGWKIEDTKLTFKDNNSKVVLKVIPEKMTEVFKEISRETIDEILENTDPKFWEEYRKTEEYKEWENMEAVGKERFWENEKK